MKFLDLIKASLVPLAFIVIIWIIFGIERYFDYSLSDYGLFPRTFTGLKGIITAPLLHGDFNHIFSNSISLFVMLWILNYFFHRSFFKIIFFIWIVGGIWTWAFARPAFHIGASGLVYGLVAFVFFSGLITKNIGMQGLALLTVFIYGSLVWGILPIEQNFALSWESHLLGGLAGAVYAIYNKNNLPPPRQYSWDIDPESDDRAEEWIQQQIADSETKENDSPSSTPPQIIYTYISKEKEN
jgi:membrane associated rhomboid family serine protease